MKRMLSVPEVYQYRESGEFSKPINGLEAIIEMKKKFLSLWDRALLIKRFIIKTVNDKLKNISYIEHSRDRSIHGFILNLTDGLIAYYLKAVGSLQISS